MEEVSKDGVVTLIDISTGHVAKLGSDHIRNFDSDNQSEIDGGFHLEGRGFFRGWGV